MIENTYYSCQDVNNNETQRDLILFELKSSLLKFILENINTTPLLHIWKGTSKGTYH